MSWLKAYLVVQVISLIPAMFIFEKFFLFYETETKVLKSSKIGVSNCWITKKDMAPMCKRLSIFGNFLIFLVWPALYALNGLITLLVGIFILFDGVFESKPIKAIKKRIKNLLVRKDYRSK